MCVVVVVRACVCMCVVWLIHNIIVFSILYQRGIYPPEDFETTSKYGMSLLVSKDSDLKQYLNSILAQLSGVVCYVLCTCCCCCCEYEPTSL